MSTIKQEADSNPVSKPLSDTTKSSMQILSELFSTFDAAPPIIVKKEKKERSTDSSKKSKKSKKKRKHKEKKHKKKSKKKKKSTSSSSSSSENDEEIDLAKLLIKQEKDKAEEKIKIEGTSLSLDIKVAINKEEQKLKSEKYEPSDKRSKESRPKIHIKDIELFSRKKERKAKKEEDGEITDSDSDHKKRKKSKLRERDKLRKQKAGSEDRSETKEKRYRFDDLREKIRASYSQESSRHSHREQPRSRDRDRDSYRSGKITPERESSRDRHDYRNRHREESFYKYRFRSRSRSRSRDRFWTSKDRYRDNRASKSPDRRQHEGREYEKDGIDKKKLLEIARRNAIQMMKSGSLPGALTLGSRAQEKMIAAIKSGGKTVEELTEFCKTLSRKEEMGELSSMSEKEESDNDEAFHHPFKLKDRPSTITMNITNSVPLPVKNTQERTTELRMQFPVSSGQQHRVNEEWVPVSPSTVTVKSSDPIKSKPIIPAIEAAPPIIDTMLPTIVTAPLNAPPGPQLFPTAGESQSSKDISSIVSERLTAMRKLQENPHDVQALGVMYKANKEMESWAKSKQQLGQFMGTTGAQVLSQSELASGYQAWAKRNQLQTAAPVSGGMGMHLLQKMGWKPGEGLGKEKTGALEPLLLEVKMDKKGLVANEEQVKNKKKSKLNPTVKTLQGKHPVSLLGEYASKKKLGAPEYVLEFECGPDHKKNFLVKVILNGMEYKPNVASHNKKEAKANAATLALKQIGLLE